LKPLLSFFRRYALQYWHWYVSGIVFLLATNWITVQIPLELAAGVDALGADGDPQRLQRSVKLIASMGVSILVVRTLSRILFFTPGRLIEYRLKNDLFQRLLELQPAFHAQWKTGDIVSRVSNDVSLLRVLVGFGILQIFNVTAALAMAGREMLRISPALTAMTLVPIAVAMLIVQVGLRRLFIMSRRSQEALADLSQHVLSSLQGVPIIQGFNAEEAFGERFLVHNKAYLDANMELAWVRALHMPLLPLAGGLSLAGLVGFGGSMAASNVITVGELVAFTTYVGILLMPLRSLGWLLAVFQRGIMGLERIYSLLNAQPDRPEGAHGHKRNRTSAPEIQLRNLTFAYPDQPKDPVLSDINADIPSGSTVGLFGRTGSGKSTLLKLISRAYNPPPNTISVDGWEILELDLDDWRSQTSVVPQQPFLFSESIEHNISMGTADAERLQETLKGAALETDLEALPNGTNTLVGERGIMLSGGQRQRVALARGLYREFDLLLLDDVLSAVDHHTEKQLIDTLVQTGRGQEKDSRPTMLLVSHRVSAMRHADNILVLDEGRLVDQGTHDELTRRPGPYQEAWQQQSGEAAIP